MDFSTAIKFESYRCRLVQLLQMQKPLLFLSRLFFNAVWQKNKSAVWCLFDRCDT
jgi:hypothetical protein